MAVRCCVKYGTTYGFNRFEDLVQDTWARALNYSYTNNFNCLMQRIYWDSRYETHRERIRRQKECHLSLDDREDDVYESSTANLVDRLAMQKWKDQEGKSATDSEDQLIFLIKKAKLTTREMQILSDRIVFGKKLQEIADEDNVSHQRISEKLNRILSKLREAVTITGEVYE
jgi:DNA-directed RNA polymerase specialized sigma24 family protein